MALDNGTGYLRRVLKDFVVVVVVVFRDPSWRSEATGSDHERTSSESTHHGGTLTRTL